MKQQYFVGFLLFFELFLSLCQSFLPDVVFDSLLDVQKEIRDLREKVLDWNLGIISEE